jgi:hypothetical protein
MQLSSGTVVHQNDYEPGEQGKLFPVQTVFESELWFREQILTLLK